MAVVLLSKDPPELQRRFVYKREGDKVLRFNACVFGPGDIYCSLWSLLALAGLDAQDWTPQYSYWRRPEVLDDGGENVLD